MLKRKFPEFFLFCFAILLSSTAMGQNSSSTSSPYSRFGFGTLNNTSFGKGDAMGGIGIGMRNSYQINSANPASYTSIDSLTFLMQFGLDAKFTLSESATANNVRNNINFNHLTFAMPYTGWWAGSFGFLPFANKGYTIKSTEGADDLLSNSSFTGTGTLTKVYIGNAFKLGKNLSLGINTWFMFGNITDNVYVYYPNDNNAYDYLKDISLQAHGLGITGGLQYSIQTKKNNNFTIGVTFEPKTNVKSTYGIHEERALFRNSSSSSEILDTIQHVVSDNKGLQMPMSYGTGFSYTYKNKLTFGADYYYQNWKDCLFLGQTANFMTNSNRYGTGFEYIPNKYSIRSYWDRAEYRLGAFYENSYMVINNTQLKSYGITFGIGFPMSRMYRSLLNVSGEIGRLGTTDNNLIRESYAKLTFHLLLHDRWFFKSKFD